MKTLLLALLVAMSGSAMAASGDASVGKKKSVTCAACHGENGVSASPEFPNLAGQYADYLESSIRHYQNGKRKNPIMQAQVKDLKTKDIMDLAAYFASQKGLQVKH
ncbi:MAG: cytochrome c [Pseudomonadota bacterium]|nr:cytochrome c [Pseudomonadota bacterium]